ncbi:MAG: 30S ribosome-binding factor RbfA [Flavobacteriales bacterium]|nr:30S ribosome-binding factor RbfA [Flavobacteriales bacterium]
MSSVRQKKIEAVIQQELGQIFREEARTYCLGAMVTVTVVRVSPDMSYAKVFLSVFGHPDIKEVYKGLKGQAGEIRYNLGKRLGKSLRRIPELDFRIDDSLDYAEEIDKLLSE